jgi:hypothetical protein
MARDSAVRADSMLGIAVGERARPKGEQGAVGEGAVVVEATLP